MADDIVVLGSPGEIMQLAQVISCLRIETRTGMKHSRGSVLKLAQRRYHIKSKTKAGALEECLALYKEVTGRDYGSR